MPRAEVVEDFEGQLAWGVHAAATRGQYFSIAPAPKPRGMSARVHWDAEHFSYAELHSWSHIPLPMFNSDLHGIISVDLYSETLDAKGFGIGLRIVDANNEVFQSRREITVPRGEWRTIPFDLSREQFTGTWTISGGTSNGRIEHPVRLLGFSFDLPPGRSGDLYFDNIVAAAGGDPVMARGEGWSFQPDVELWTITPYGSGSASLAPLGSDLRLEIYSSAQTQTYRLTERYFSTRYIEQPAELGLRLDLVSGPAPTFRLRLVDATGETFQYEPKTPVSGLQTLTWDLTLPPASHSGGNNDGVLDPPLRFAEINIHKAAGGGSSVLRLIEGSWRKPSRHLKAIRTYLDTANGINVLTPEAFDRFSIAFQNTADQSTSFDYSIRLEDYWGNTIQTVSGSLALSADARTTLPLPAPPLKGFYSVVTTLTDPGSPSAQWIDQATLAVIDPALLPPVTPNQFLFGLNSHIPRYGLHDRRREALAMALAGASISRVSCEWGHIQPAPGVWNWALQDSIVALLEEHGIEVQALYAYTPRWAAPLDKQNSADWLDWSRAAPDPDAWREYVAAMAARYQDQVRFYEVWNEPDGYGFWRGTNAEYRNLLRIVHEEVRAIHPGLRILTGGFTAPDWNPALLRAVCVDDRPHYDILAMHIHGSFPAFAQSVDGDLAALREQIVPPAPLLYNETGFSGTLGRDRTQADTIVRKLTFAWSRDAIGFIAYTIRNDGESLTDSEHNYGFMTRDFQPKPAFAAFHAMVRLLRGKTALPPRDIGQERYLLVFSQPGEQVVIAWNDAAVAEDEEAILRTDAASAEIIDMMGNPEPGGNPLSGQEARIPLRRTTTYLVLRGASGPPQVIWTTNGLPTSVRQPWLYN